MRDEMAACMLDESPVREDILTMVCDHITHSPSRSTCLLETIPLHFVYEIEQCHQKFRQVSLRQPEAIFSASFGWIYFCFRNWRICGSMVTERKRKEASSIWWKISKLVLKNTSRPKPRKDGVRCRIWSRTKEAREMRRREMRVPWKIRKAMKHRIVNLLRMKKWKVWTILGSVSRDVEHSPTQNNSVQPRVSAHDQASPKVIKFNLTQF